MTSTAIASNGYVFERDRPPRHWLYIILIVCAFLGSALIWSANAEIDEVSRAGGRVIPSSKTQVVEATQSGSIGEILVRAGERVQKDELLVKLDDTSTSSSAGELEARVYALKAQVARLRIETEGRASQGYTCPEDVKSDAPDVCANEAELLQARLETHQQSKRILEQRVEQRRRELNEARDRLTQLKQAQQLAVEELELVKPLAQDNLISQTEFIAARRRVVNTRGERNSVAESIERLEAALSEARLQARQSDLQFRQEAQTELTQRLSELSSAEQALRGASGRLDRTAIKAPVDGTINEVSVNTIGAFVSPGDRILDIVPSGDKLVVEGRLKPSDVAFIIPGQEAKVKFTAYDFSIYGGLEGEVTSVSADSITDPETRQTYYVVRIETDKTQLDFEGEKLPLMPGMVANVEILTGKKTILQYLLKPINRAREEALSER